MKFILITLLLGQFLLCGSIGFAEDPDEPPGSIKLLPGYTHQRLRGIDTSVGKITRKDGLTIQYDIGPLAGNYALKEKEGCKWFKEQVVNGHTIQVAFKKTKELTVTFSNGPANFFATV